METPRYFSQPLKTGARVVVNRPRRGDDILFEICRCSSATKAEEIAQALNATDAVKRAVLPLAMP